LLAGVAPGDVAILGIGVPVWPFVMLLVGVIIGMFIGRK
jgi:uncharacterized protein YneF (UPF0154 family)